MLNNLKTTLLETQTHQHKVILLTNLKVWQEEYLHLLNHTTELSELWLEVKAYEKKASYFQNDRSVEIPQFLRTYEGTSELYTQEITAVLKQVDLSNFTPEKISPTKKQLLDFTNGSVYLKLHSASDDLEKVVNGSYNDLEGAEAAVMAAQKLRDEIIIISMLLSIAIAFLLASYTSRAIARPIQALTSIAQKVTQESNFNLQAPVTTKDEVGTLAISLNQLIQKVNTLLEQQKAEASRQLIQNEKMSSLGRMVAGVAHEINNPVNCIYGNVEHIALLCQARYKNPTTPLATTLLTRATQWLPNPLPASREGAMIYLM